MSIDICVFGECKEVFHKCIAAHRCGRRTDMEGLRIGKKYAKVPVIQGGMGIGISLGRLAGAVAKEGGVGIISAAQIGFREPDFDTNTKEANLRAIKKEF